MIRTLFLALFILNVAHAEQAGYGENRARNDRDPRTLAARRYFDQNTNRIFNSDRAGVNLQHVDLKLNHRMVAQRARGAESANAIIPQELNQILWFIHHARTNRDATLRRLISLPSLRGYDRRDIAEAVAQVAATESISMSYWGYLGSEEQLPQFNLKSKQLTYFARWNERESRYVKYGSNHMMRNVVRGIIEAMNYKPWYSRLTGN